MRDLTRTEIEAYHKRMHDKYVTLTQDRPEPSSVSKDEEIFKLQRQVVLERARVNLLSDYSNQLEEELQTKRRLIARIADMVATYEQPVLHTLPQPIRVEIAGLLEDVK